jgi:small-conductance mechanosensitive channel/CRP-like cAMP-binding protein
MTDDWPWELTGATALLALSLPQQRWPLWLRLTFQTACLLGITALIAPSFGSPFSPQFTSSDTARRIWEQSLEAGWWFMAARIAVTAVRLVVVFESRPRETQFLSDLLTGVIYLAALLAIFRFAFSLQVTALLATSGVIAIVLGLALQSTLSDVFSGLSIGLERPFKPGDFVWIEGGVEGRVTQINWRSTHFVNAETNLAIVPNSVIAKARLINRSEPTLVYRDTVVIRLDPAKETGLCTATLTAAVKACHAPLRRPPPEVNCTGLHGDGNLYEIAYSVAASDQVQGARNELFGSVQRHLYHQGVGIGTAGLQAAPSPPAPTLNELLERSDLFGVLNKDARDALAPYFVESSLNEGDRLIEQGSVPDALFVIVAGAVELTVKDGAAPFVVSLKGPGESLGVIGLVTSTEVTSTATALTPLRAYRLSKARIADAIHDEPTLATGIEALAKCGRAALRRDAAAPEGEEAIKPELLLSRLRHFVQVLMVSR